MAAATIFQDFVGHLGLGYHGNLNTNTCKVALFQAAAAVANTGSVYADYSANEVANGNGYTTGGADSTNTYSESAGTGTLGGTDIVWTASGGAINNIRYAILYNDQTTTVTDGLIEFWDYGSEIDLAVGETFTFDIQTSLLTIS